MQLKCQPPGPHISQPHLPASVIDPSAKMGQAMGPGQGSGPLLPLGQNGSQGFEEPPPAPRASKHSTDRAGLLPARHCAENLGTWGPMSGVESLPSGDSHPVGKGMIYRWQVNPGRRRGAEELGVGWGEAWP